MPLLAEALALFWWLGVAHAVTDVYLQDPRLWSIGEYKQRKEYPGHWPFWLVAHGLINGAGVAIVTGNPFLGMAETVAHSAIDFGKCEGYYGVNVDQALHLACKIGWVYVVYAL